MASQQKCKMFALLFMIKMIFQSLSQTIFWKFNYSERLLLWRAHNMQYKDHLMTTERILFMHVYLACWL